jgi:Zn-dependent protease
VVAIVGPIVSLAIFTVLNLIQINFSFRAPITAIISLLTSINLIPCLPLNRGNILKALVSQITGNSNQEIIFASRVGQVFA